MKASVKSYWIMLITMLLSSSLAVSQSVSYEKTLVEVPLILTVDPSDVKVDWMPKLTNGEMPMPGSSRYAMEQVKKESAAKYPRVENGIQSWEPNGSAPTVGMSFPVANTVILPNDTLIQYIAGGTPNDNTLAISDSGIVLTSFNSQLYAYDTNRDTAIMLISLDGFSSQFTNNSKFDPKLTYDPIEDRFILVFLNGSASNESQIIVCFSSTNDPLDPWNLYALSGNPFNDSTWLDYPAVSVTEDELFITGNQIFDTGPWQTAFAQSVIWQVDKNDGYNGDSILTTTLWSDIKTDGRFIRNLHLVQGGSWPTGPSQYLLSNRNFDILNDTIFLLELEGTQDSNSVLNINIGISDEPYGMPPNGRQNHIDSLNTNDARVLGAFVENGEIQFVSVTVDTNTGFASIYHGFINDLDSTPVFTATILTDDSLDLGYPNIAYTGTHSCSRQAIIGMDHTSFTRNPGISAVLYHSDNTYSSLITLKEAESPVIKSFTINHERWGDYFGIQRRYNEKNTVWTAGFYGRQNGNYTWLSELTTEEELPITVTVTKDQDASIYNTSDGILVANPTNGVLPYQIIWNDPSAQTSLTATGLGKGTYKVTVRDGAECEARDSMIIEEPLPKSNLFPNPTLDVVTIYFELEQTGVIEVELYDDRGRLVQALFSDKAKAGSNIFTFSGASLSAGTYILRVVAAGKSVITEKFIKQ